jgi:peptidoglycan/xylan/chitin deacetylase (PgdA/CDA1 family)
MNPESKRVARRVPVLMYHRVGHAATDWETKYCVSPERFASHMSALKRRGMDACSVEDFVAWLDGHRELRHGTFVLTFDDGFLGVHQYAYPLLVELGWPATVFLVSSLIGNEDQWCRRENPTGRTYPLMGRAEVNEMARNGFSFHSHSRSHWDLTKLGRGALSEELAGSRRELEDLLGRPVPFFAYPYGRYDATVLEVTREAGYRAAFSVQPGFNRPDVDRYRIRRLDVFGTDTAMALLRKIAFGTNDGSVGHVIRYYVDRVASRLGARKEAA